MPLLIENITDEADQTHTLVTPAGDIRLRLVYHSVTEMWTYDATYKGVEVLGLRLAVDTLHQEGRNLPFDFVVIDNSNTGLDPFRREDFSEGRCSLLRMTADDMGAYRGGPVPL